MKFTADELYEAIEKNGYPWTSGEWVSRGADGSVIGACAVGQGLLNLGLSDVQISQFVEKYANIVEPIYSFNDKKIHYHTLNGVKLDFTHREWNDEIECHDEYHSYPEIAEFAKRQLKGAPHVFEVE